MGVACHKIPKMWMTIFHSAYIPQHISDIQAKQMDTLGKNIHVVRVKTDFDGCAALASDLQRDPELGYMHPNSANSVNIGRLLPQINYYFHVYSRVAKNDEDIRISVPSGNFGNTVAGLMAMKMGLPIKIIVGVNENDVYERFYRTGIYAPAENAHPSPSNSMNVNWPSNIRRLFQLYGGQLVEGKDPDNSQKKVISSMKIPNLKEIREDMAAYRISDDKMNETIEEFYSKNHRIGKGGRLHSTLETHGAVAFGAANEFRKTGYDGKIIIFETAHPGKFPEHLEGMGIKPEPPKCLSKLDGVPHGKFFEIDNNYNAAKSLLIGLYQKELAKNK